MRPGWITFGLLLASNCFMTVAWYGHLKYKGKPLWLVILVSWAIAFFEYCLMVPANRIGSQTMSGYQLKILQEATTLVVFIGFAWLYLGERLRWNYSLAMLLILGAVALTFVPADS
ncbi:MAG: DMT family protein [Acidobacteria bacterium]|nr:DMT family protein [Acidobacteriota bacterium]